MGMLTTPSPKQGKTKTTFRVGHKFLENGALERQTAICSTSRGSEKGYIDVYQKSKAGPTSTSLPSRLSRKRLPRRFHQHANSMGMSTVTDSQHHTETSSGVFPTSNREIPRATTQPRPRTHPGSLHRRGDG